jgi:hypothetical protein
MKQAFFRAEWSHVWVSSRRDETHCPAFMLAFSSVFPWNKISVGERVIITTRQIPYIVFSILQTYEVPVKIYSKMLPWCTKHDAQEKANIVLITSSSNLHHSSGIVGAGRGITITTR